MIGRSQSGFTLMELLVSMTLLSLLLVALFGGLRFAGRGGERIEAVLEDSQRLDLVRGLLARQTAQLFPVEAGPAGAAKLLFTGRPDRLAFPILRLPGQGPAGLVLAVFDITSESGVSRLIYREYPFEPGALVAVAETPTRSTELVESKGRIAFRFRGRTPLWQPEWKETASLPRLVALDIADWPELMAAPRAEAVAQ
jgi:general secretion pathway protein J